MFRLPESSSSSSNIKFVPKISKYYVTFLGTTIETTVTDKASTATEWVEFINSLYGGTPTVVGLDVHPRTDKPATLQLCVDAKCLILQLLYIDEIPKSIKDFLVNPNFIFVGNEVGDVVFKLKNKYGLKCCFTFDVVSAATSRCSSSGWLKIPGSNDREFREFLSRINTTRYFDRVRASNWEAREIKEYQIEYACINTFASYKIAHKLLINK